jgi:iron complex transport system substrate-binding protein
MKTMPARRRLLRAILIAPWVALPTVALASGAATRVICLGGTVTEIVYALGAGDRLVGVDLSSRYPADASRLPQVGYYRDFSIEGVASLRPNLVLASEHAGPGQALDSLGRLGIPVVRVPARASIDSLTVAISTVAGALGLKSAGEALIASVRKELGPAPAGRPPAVLVVSSHTGRLQGAGGDTSAGELVRIAGGANLLEQQAGYRPIPAESVAALAPEVIVTTRLSIGPDGIAGFARQPGITTTPAAREGRIHAIDDLLLLGFGPRVPEAVALLRAIFSDR